jgi:hypothetical protein
VSTDYYGANIITNGDAETGDLTDWTSTGVTAESGGHAGDYSFYVAQPGIMYQTLSPANLSDLQFTCYFLPHDEADPLDYKPARAFVRINYSDGTYDDVQIPCETLI